MTRDLPSVKLLKDTPSSYKTPCCGCPCGRHWSSEEEQVAKEKIQAGSEPCWLAACFTIPEGWYQRHVIHSIYFFCGMMLSFLVITATYIWFIMCSKCLSVWTFASAECLVRQVSMSPSTCPCNAASGAADDICPRNVTCLVSVAEFRAGTTENVTLQLFETADDMYWAFSEGTRCSVRPACGSGGGVRDEDERRIQGALRSWAVPGHSVRCRYNPRSAREAYMLESPFARAVVATGAAVVLAVGGCAVVLLATFTTCGWRYVWPRRPPVDVQQEAQRRHLASSSGSMTFPSPGVDAGLCPSSDLKV